MNKKGNNMMRNALTQSTGNLTDAGLTALVRGVAGSGDTGEGEDAGRTLQITKRLRTHWPRRQKILR